MYLYILTKLMLQNLLVQSKHYRLLTDQIDNAITVNILKIYFPKGALFMAVSTDLWTMYAVTEPFFA